jgi:hypothetical protein
VIGEVRLHSVLSGRCSREEPIFLPVLSQSARLAVPAAAIVFWQVRCRGAAP